MFFEDEAISYVTRDNVVEFPVNFPSFLRENPIKVFTAESVSNDCLQQ